MQITCFHLHLNTIRKHPAPSWLQELRPISHAISAKELRGQFVRYRPYCSDTSYSSLKHQRKPECRTIVLVFIDLNHANYCAFPLFVAQNLKYCRLVTFKRQAMKAGLANPVSCFSRPTWRGPSLKIREYLNRAGRNTLVIAQQRMRLTPVNRRKHQHGRVSPALRTRRLHGAFIRRRPIAVSAVCSLKGASVSDVPVAFVFVAPLHVGDHRL